MLHAQAKELGIKYFLVSFAELVLARSAKLRTAAIDDFARRGPALPGSPHGST